VEEDDSDIEDERQAAANAEPAQGLLYPDDMRSALEQPEVQREHRQDKKCEAADALVAVYALRHRSSKLSSGLTWEIDGEARSERKKFSGDQLEFFAARLLPLRRKWP
jgi:hypothetical protein